MLSRAPSVGGSYPRLDIGIGLHERLCSVIIAWSRLRTRSIKSNGCGPPTGRVERRGIRFS